MKTLLFGSVIFCLLGQFPERTIEIVGGPKLPDRPTFMVGVVEANGNLVPVASFGRNDWMSTSASALAGRPVEWTLWYENPGASPGRRGDWTRRLIPAGIEFASTGLYGELMPCEKALGLSTDIEDRRASLIECDNCCPEPKLGIATTAKSPPMLAEVLDPEGGDSLRIMAEITDRFNLMEDQASAHILFRYGMGKRRIEHRGPWGDAETRRQIPLKGENLYRFQGDGRTLYYIEARRRFPVPEEVFFPTSSFLKAWMVEVDSELAWISQGVELRGADTKTLRFDTPIAFWNRGDKVDVLFRRTGWEDENYLIITVTSDGIFESADRAGL